MCSRDLHSHVSSDRRHAFRIEASELSRSLYLRLRIFVMVE